jgi:hypothetical protein
MKLSKTNFITYLDCVKNTWLKIHKPEVYYEYPLSSFEQNIIDTGNQIDQLARDLFPGGVTVELREDTDYTQKLIDQETPVIYQPVFATDKFIAASDIFVWNKETKLYDVYEVKASTSFEEGGRGTEDYVVDMAFQKVVLDELGVSIGTINLITLNKEYVRNGDLSIHGLLLPKDLTKEVNESLAEIKGQMDTAYHFLSSEKEPSGYCDCILKGRNSHCTTSEYSNKDIPKYSVHAIARIHKTKLTDLVDNKILDIKDVPEDFELSDIQRRQVDTAQSGKPYINKEGISEFLKTMKYPLSFLDYETYPSAIPRYNGYRPYQQIPFQFSLHTLESPESELVHECFIYTDHERPDEQFAEALQKYLPKTGSIVVWNQKFEKGINKEIGERLKDYESFMAGVNERVVDLMVPFSGKTLVYDHPGFKGSASIKYVLPALVPSRSYKEMHIQDGGTAADTWNRIVSGEYSAEEREVKIQALKDYCHLDTLAMVDIWKVLSKV